MNFNKLFHNFKMRMLWEVFLKASLFAITLSASSVFLISLIYHFLMTDAPNWMLTIAFPSVLLLGFVVYFCCHYPTHKTIAARIDEIGLQERISTMLEFGNRETEILRLQRMDALAHLHRTNPVQLKLRPLGNGLLLCLLCILSAVIITRIPYDIWKVEVVETEISDEQLQIIEDLLTQLREEVDDAAFSQELTQQLNSIINQLEQDFKESNSDLEMVAQLENARQQMMEALQDTLTMYKIGEALQQYELTRALGEAISLGDGNAVSTALLDLEILLNDDNSLISGLSEIIDAALIASGVHSEEELFQALNEFSMNLRKVPASEDIHTALSEAFAAAEEAILAALADQIATEFEMNALDDIFSQAKDLILGINPDLPEYAPPNIDMPDSGQQEGEGEMPGNGQPEGEMPDGEMPEDGQGEGDSEGDGEDEMRMIEGIYDPVSGNVSYGEVFALYYAEYLKALEAGEVPEELQEIINQYFSTLDQ